MRLAIRQKRKPVVLPAARLYLEDIEEILALMIVAERETRPGANITTSFTVGKRQCDSIEDLKKIGGTWRHFEISINNNEKFIVDPTLSTEWRVYDYGDSFPKLLRLLTARELLIRSFLRRTSFVTFLIVSGICAVIGSGLMSVKMNALGLFVWVFPYLVAGWALYAHTIVELRYSHDPSPKLAWFKERGEKVGWLVVGTFLGLLGQWLWKHFSHQ